MEFLSDESCDIAFVRALRDASGAKSAGVVLLRYPVPARRSVIQGLLKVVSEKGEQLHGCFTVVEPGKVRFKSRPDSA